MKLSAKQRLKKDKISVKNGNHLTDHNLTASR